MVNKNNKEVLKTLLIEFKEVGVPDDLKSRRIEIETEEKKAAVLSGVRRAGKTYRMYQMIEDIDEEEMVFYINFEDERLMNPDVEDLSQLLPIIRETFEGEGPIYLFVDEIQRIEGWERWARRMAESENVILTISGSSSQLSSQEIASSLRGRTLTTSIFPLNFHEFLDFKNVELDMNRIEYSKERPKMKRYFNEYLEYGGFPEIVLEEDELRKQRILREYFSTIVARDLIERCSIEKINALESFMKLLVNNFSRLISFSKARNWLKSMGIKVSKSTVGKYFEYLKSSYFLFDTTIHSRSVKDRLQYPRKVYLIDNGFATALTERFSSDRGWFYENLVAVSFYRKTILDPRKELHHWRKDGKEVDFVVRKGTETEELIQVCSDLNVETRDREVKNLLAASEEMECDELKVITDDTHELEEIDGKEVEFVPLWLILLKESRDT